MYLLKSRDRGNEAAKTYKLAMLTIAATERLVVRRFDICRAFLHTPSRTTTLVVPPVEAGEESDIYWSLNVAAYGLEEAMTEFDAHFSEIVEKLPHPFRRSQGGPTIFCGETLQVVFSVQVLHKVRDALQHQLNGTAMHVVFQYPTNGSQGVVLIHVC